MSDIKCFSTENPILNRSNLTLRLIKGNYDSNEDVQLRKVNSRPQIVRPTEEVITNLKASNETAEQLPVPAASAKKNM